MNRFVTATWIITLSVAVFGVVPAAVLHLRRLLIAARNIEQYTADILDAGAGIAAQTAGVGELSQTIAGATILLEKSESIERSVETVERALSPGEDTDGTSTDAEGP